MTSPPPGSEDSCHVQPAGCRTHTTGVTPGPCFTRIKPSFPLTPLMSLLLNPRGFLQSFIGCLIFFFFFFGCTGSSLLHMGFCLVAEGRGYSSLWCAGFSLQRLSQSTASRASVVSAHRLSSCGTWAYTPGHVKSQTRDRAGVPCIGRKILMHSREVLFLRSLSWPVLGLQACGV